MDHLQKVFLVDVDNTLIDTERIKEIIQEKFLEKFGKTISLEDFWEIYRRVSEEKGYVDIKEIADRVTRRLGLPDNNQTLALFTKISFKDCLLPGALNLLALLKTKGKVVIYSWGDELYQPLKIKESGIEEIVGEDNVIISQHKQDDLKNIIKVYQGCEEIIIIDDNLEIIERAKEINPAIKGIWMRFGKYKNSVPKSNDTINFESDSPESLYQLFVNEKI